MADKIEQVQACFRQWDTDGSGSISRKEFVNVLTTLGMPRNQAEQLFATVDVNNDEDIDFEEFIEWLQSGTKVAEKVKSKTLYRDGDGKKLNAIQVLKKRFPDKKKEELEEALFYADGHGGKAVAYLNGEWKPPSSGLRNSSRLSIAANIAHDVQKEKKRIELTDTSGL
eukprot:gnl/TRDRNA2_/TRDRNA2_56407_c0_seq1.p1 gnl/TRDRNA2_/TRDRNA2_56407_c0~~gnl/TRDRNA2_/TRDRNA2_56407_c0_seq1.p1  ORF type:complete len:181 (+),score=39.70 gnl/TRDRNA2_/TRDRNA2_56407_c0_seq1:39-545(+)